jgi:biopolymer transport protein ExbD
VVHSPGRRLARARRLRRGETSATLNLTGLVDVMVVLVIFGLLDFSASGELDAL